MVSGIETSRITGAVGLVKPCAAIDSGAIVRDCPTADHHDDHHDHLITSRPRDLSPRRPRSSRSFITTIFALYGYDLRSLIISFGGRYGWRMPMDQSLAQMDLERGRPRLSRRGAPRLSSRGAPRLSPRSVHHGAVPWTTSATVIAITAWSI